MAIKRLRSQGARESGGLEGPAVAHAAATTATTATTGSAERDARDSDFAYHSDVDSGGDTDREERDGENNNDFEGPHTSGKQEGRTGAGAAHVSQAIIAEAARMQRARLLRKPARQIHLVAFGENKLPRGPPHSSEAPACAPCRPSEAEYKTNNAWLRRSRGSTHNQVRWADCMVADNCVLLSCNTGMYSLFSLATEWNGTQISNVTCEAQDTEFPSLADAAVIAVRKSAHKYKLRHSPHFSPFVPSRDAEDEAAADWVDLSLEREREREEEVRHSCVPCAVCRVPCAVGGHGCTRGLVAWAAKAEIECMEFEMNRERWRAV